MNPKAKKFHTVPLSDQHVELVGGPLCGKIVPWEKGKKEEMVSYYGGLSVYRYDGPSDVAEDGRITAIHIGG
jgi:hypothetical protein